MNDIEKKILKSNYKEKISVDERKFLSVLHTKIEQSEENKKIKKASFGMMILILMLSINQNRILNNSSNHYFEQENWFGLDFYSIESDSLKFENDYVYDLSIFLLEEGYTWEVLDLINELDMEVLI